MTTISSGRASWPCRARVAPLRRAGGKSRHHHARPFPGSFDAVRAKIQGRTFGATDIHAIIDDLTHFRYSDMEIAAFLIGSASFMTTGELLALTEAMSNAGTRLSWNTPVVVDKHCIGGIPGNRTSMVVVPIVAAHGLTIPKTSSRAITSPAGTADTMEVLTRVDLGVDEMKQVVAACRGCLVWGGHVNLSPPTTSSSRWSAPLRSTRASRWLPRSCRRSSRRGRPAC